MFVAVALPGDDAWLELQAAGATAADVVVAVDSNTGAAVLADGVRSARRKGLLTTCISCDSASASTLAAEYVVHLPLEAVCESVALKEAAAKQMALDALLTAVLENIGVIALQNDDAAAAVGLDESTLRAVENLMSQCPGLERESAVELIVKYGSVRKAAQAYKANV
jgi:N-acetylmuramic acid 6-phosphate etherase